ncbi:ribonuclease P protein component [Dactylosporangium darangshiense]|uniref:Ribonuclease P protein component n=1 Tax=Dactylosporangium darangshiense TaxID=579108 RepID=A0ABP8CVL0_9ACTN
MLAAGQRLRRREDFAATIRNGRRAGRGAVVVHFLNPGPPWPGVDPFSSPAEPSGGSEGVAPSLSPSPSPDGAGEASGDVDLRGSSDDASVTGTPGAPAARAGFVVSKAVGNAVVRNAVKRRLRHLVRPRLADLPAGSVIVVRALPEAARAGYHQLEQDLDAALQAARRPRNRGDRR